ncbi:MAG: heavy metal-binding domain-containing protein [Candidatus Sericytochromatia bacterium]|nr:heavy metal-binding domain-containing protein [Candidatus Sericytochromatia bacterium]
MMYITGLSGNEIYCAHKLGYQAGDVVIGNSVHSMGFIGSISSGFKSMVGGEIVQFTQLIEEGRETSYARMEKEAVDRNGYGITGVRNELIFHNGNIEFLSIGSSLHTEEHPRTDKLNFSTSSDGQELFCQVDAGYTPHKFVFGNIAYSMGIGASIISSFKSLGRGEVKEYSDVFNTTRKTTLERIIRDAKKHSNKANAVVGIRTNILPIGASGFQEMLMIGTASHHPLLPPQSSGVVTSDLTCAEMWNLTKMGYAPISLVLGTSVYSLGIAGSLTSFFKSFTKGEIPELSKMIYDARENSIDSIKRQSKGMGADSIVGVKTYVYQLGGGLIEFLAIGTAIKKVDGLTTKSDELIPQAIIHDKDTFINNAEFSYGIDLNEQNAK